MFFANNQTSKINLPKGNHIKKWAVCVALVLFGIVFFLHWSAQKEVWFCDEIYTFESAHGMEQSWPASNTAQWMTGEDMEAFFSADSDSLSLEWISNSLYNDHVPLYFWLFRIVAFLGFKGSSTLWTGYTINLFFYLLFLVIGYHFFVHLTKKPLAAGGIILISSIVNKIMIAQTTTIRMYMMLAWAELILVIIGLKILHDKDQGKLKAGTYISLCLFSVIGLLTHYDYWIFYAITAALFCSWLLFLAFKKKKTFFFKTTEFKCVLAWVGNFCTSLLLTILIFPYCRWNLNRGKGQTALHSVFVFSSEKVENIAWGARRLSASIFGDSFSPILGLLLVFLCIAGAAIVLYKKKEHAKASAMILMVLISLGYQFVVCFTMPDVNEERYLWGAFTFIHMCLIWSGYLLIDVLLIRLKDVKIHSICSGLLYICFSVFLLFTQFKTIDGGNGIPYLFHPYKDVAALESHSDLPWVVYGPTLGVYSYYDWLIPEQICFLSPDNTADDAAAVSELQDDKSFILYTHEDYLPLALAFFEQELGKELSGDFLTTSTNLTVYVVSETTE